MYYEFEPASGFQDSGSGEPRSPTRAVVIESAAPLQMFANSPAQVGQVVPLRSWLLTPSQVQDIQNRLAAINSSVGDASYLYSTLDATYPNNQLVLSGAGIRYRNCWGFVSDVMAGVDATEPVPLGS
jgi:hypothetical protein